MQLAFDGERIKKFCYRSAPKHTKHNRSINQTQNLCNSIWLSNQRHSSVAQGFLTETALGHL